jgi:PadR family transcriptional regulator, regulatory protein PadR
MNNDDKFSAIKKGLLEMVVLKIISRDKLYAAEILDILSRTEFATQDGTLYPLLSRLKREGLVDYQWVESEAGPPRKYYQLTAKGETQLKSILEYWDNLNSTIKNLNKNL